MSTICSRKGTLGNQSWSWMEGLTYILTSIWPFSNARNHQTQISFIMKYVCDCVIVSIYLCPMICLNLSGKYIVCTVTCVLEVRRLKKKRCQMLTKGCIFSKHASSACFHLAMWRVYRDDQSWLVPKSLYEFSKLSYSTLFILLVAYLNLVIHRSFLQLLLQLMFI